MRILSSLAARATPAPPLSLFRLVTNLLLAGLMAHAAPALAQATTPTTPTTPLPANTVRVQHLTSFHTNGAAGLPRVADPALPTLAANGQLYGLTSSLYNRAQPSVYRLPPTPAHYQVEYLSEEQRARMRHFMGRLVQTRQGHLYGLALQSDGLPGGVIKAEFDGTHLAMVPASQGQLRDPVGQLVVDAQDNLYGLDAGPGGAGRIFKVASDGQFSTVHTFPAAVLAAGDTLSHRQPVWLALGRDGTLVASLLTGWQWQEPIPGGTRSHTRYATSFHRIDPSRPASGATLLAELPGETLMLQAPVPASNQPGSSFVEAADGHLYGSASGLLFRMDRQGQDFRVLHRFATSDTQTAPAPGQGMVPSGEMVAAPDGNVYGTTFSGGANKTPVDAESDGSAERLPTFDGTLYRIVTTHASGEGGGFQHLHSFSKALDGKRPLGLSLGADGKLYGATLHGGQPYVDVAGRQRADDNKGTVFQVDLNGDAPAASVTLTVDQPLLALGGSATLTWTSHGAADCVASGGSAGWPGARPAQGSFSVQPASGLYYYALSCRDTLRGGQVSTTPVVLRVNAADHVQDSNSTDYGNGGGGTAPLLLAALAGLGALLRVRSRPSR